MSHDTPTSAEREAFEAWLAVPEQDGEWSTRHTFLAGYRAGQARAATQTAEPCTDPDACNAQGCRNPLGRCEDAAPDRAPSTDSAAGWISVDERLPDVPFFIVRSTRHDEDSIDGIEQFEGIWAVRPVASATEETLRRWIARHEVTHWMPLPATPGATMHPEGGNDA